MGVQVEQLSSQSETKPSKTRFVQELREEFKKISWTSKNELIVFTKVVIGSTFAFGLGIYSVDLAIKSSLNGFSALIHLIFG